MARSPNSDEGPNMLGMGWGCVASVFSLGLLILGTVTFVHGYIDGDLKNVLCPTGEREGRGSAVNLVEGWFSFVVVANLDGAAGNEGAAVPPVEINNATAIGAAAGAALLQRFEDMGYEVAPGDIDIGDVNQSLDNTSWQVHFTVDEVIQNQVDTLIEQKLDFKPEFIKMLADETENSEQELSATLGDFTFSQASGAAFEEQFLPGRGIAKNWKRYGWDMDDLYADQRKIRLMNADGLADGRIVMPQQFVTLDLGCYHKESDAWVGPLVLRAECSTFSAYLQKCPGARDDACSVDACSGSGSKSAVPGDNTAAVQFEHVSGGHYKSTFDTRGLTAGSYYQMCIDAGTRKGRTTNDYGLTITWGRTPGGLLRPLKDWAETRVTVLVVEDTGPKDYHFSDVRLKTMLLGIGCTSLGLLGIVLAILECCGGGVTSRGERCGVAIGGAAEALMLIGFVGVFAFSMLGLVGGLDFRTSCLAVEETANCNIGDSCIPAWRDQLCRENARDAPDAINCCGCVMTRQQAVSYFYNTDTPTFTCLDTERWLCKTEGMFQAGAVLGSVAFVVHVGLLCSVFLYSKKAEAFRVLRIRADAQAERKEKKQEEKKHKARVARELAKDEAKAAAAPGIVGLQIQGVVPLSTGKPNSSTSKAKE